MSAHNIQFHYKMRKFPLIFVFLRCRKNFVGTQKRVRISHGKRAIGVRATEVLLYICFCQRNKKTQYFSVDKKKCPNWSNGSPLIRHIYLGFTGKPLLETLIRNVDRLG